MCLSHVQCLKDLNLALAVAVLVLIDVSILLVYTIVEGLNGNLNATLVQNEENPFTEIGVSIMHGLTFLGNTLLAKVDIDNNAQYMGKKTTFYRLMMNFSGSRNNPSAQLLHL